MVKKYDSKGRWNPLARQGYKPTRKDKQTTAQHNAIHRAQKTAQDRANRTNKPKNT